MQDLLTLPSHPPTFPGRTVAQKKHKQLSAVPPRILFCLLIILFSLFPLLLHLQSQTSAAGQGDVPLKPEEFNVGETTGEKLIAFPGLQSAPHALPIPLPSLPPFPSTPCAFPAEFPSEAYAPAVSGLPFVPAALFIVMQLLQESPRWLQLWTLIRKI